MNSNFFFQKHDKGLMFIIVIIIAMGIVLHFTRKHIEKKPQSNTTTSISQDSIFLSKSYKFNLSQEMTLQVKQDTVTAVSIERPAVKSVTDNQTKELFFQNSRTYFLLLFSMLTICLVASSVLLLYRWFAKTSVKIWGFFFVLLGAILVNLYYYCIISEVPVEKKFFPIFLGTINQSLSVFFPSRGSYRIHDLLGEKQSTFLILYYVSHLLAYVYFALLAISVINAGRRMMNGFRGWTSWGAEQYTFAGANEASILLAKDLMKNEKHIRKTKKHIRIVFYMPYSEMNNHELFEKLDSLGFIVRYVPFDGSNMFKVSRKHIKKCSACFFLDNNEDINIKLALKFAQRLKEIKIQKKLDIYLRAETEDIDLLFDNEVKNANKSCNLHVHIFNQSDITARQFVIDHPMLYAPISTPEENNILILGFGYMGKEILKKTICDAQYSKKRLSVTVIDEKVESQYSDFLFRCKEAIDEYNIVFNPNSVNYARCKEFFGWLLENNAFNLLRFNRIFVTLGNSQLNIDVAQTICNLRRNYGLENSKDVIFAHINEKGAYNYFDEHNKNRSITIFGNPDKIYTVNVVINETVDAVAKAINHFYRKRKEENKDDNDKSKNVNITESEAWGEMFLFKQNSSRAAAIGLWNIALLTGYRLTKISESKQIKKEELDKIKKANKERFDRIIANNIEEFAEYEHLRWNADMRLNGVSCWDYKTVNKNVTNSNFEINGKLVKHLCLVEYDKLDIISELITNNTRRDPDKSDFKEDFKVYDRENVKNLFGFLENTNYWIEKI